MRDEMINHLDNTEDIELTDFEQLAYIINSVGGKDPSPESKKIIHSYVIGEIDFETAESLLLKK